MTDPSPPDPSVEPLLDAVLAIAEDVDLDRVLRRIVRASRQLVGARYAALGVLDATGTELAAFLHEGVDAETAARIGELPRGHGVLGEVIVQARPLRLDALADHPRSVALPPGHPPMREFLGVPVLVGDTVFGNLYLTEKPGGFGAEDERMLLALAAVAGAAIRNARDVAELAETAARDAAVAHVATAVLGGAGVDDALEQARLAAAELADGRPVSVADEDAPELPPGAVTQVGDEARLVVSPEGRQLAVTGPQLPAEVVRRLGAFAAATSLALGYASTREEMEALAVRLERQRIGRDLHDTVIQRLFGAGLQLKALERTLPVEAATSELLESVLEQLDGAIGDLRATIGALQAPPERTLEEQLRGVVAALHPIAVGLQPLRLRGHLDRVPPGIAADLPPVLREAVTNAARHAQAMTVAASVEVTHEQVLLVVRDDGVGPPDPDRARADRTSGYGLGNLAARALAHGGDCELVAGPDGRGAQLRWWVPIG